MLSHDPGLALALNTRLPESVTSDWSCHGQTTMEQGRLE